MLQYDQVIVNNRSFSDHKLWYQKKLMMDTEDLSLSKFDKTSLKRSWFRTIQIINVIIYTIDIMKFYSFSPFM